MSEWSSSDYPSKCVRGVCVHVKKQKPNLLNKNNILRVLSECAENYVDALRKLKKAKAILDEKERRFKNVFGLS